MSYSHYTNIRLLRNNSKKYAEALMRMHRLVKKCR